MRQPPLYGPARAANKKPPGVTRAAQGRKEGKEKTYSRSIYTSTDTGNALALIPSSGNRPGDDNPALNYWTLRDDLALWFKHIHAATRGRDRCPR